MSGTTFSDRELAEWAGLRKQGRHYSYWKETPKGFAVEDAANALAGETLEMRRILREWLARLPENTVDPLALRAVEVLGFNLEPSQPMFPRWPTPSSGAAPEGGKSQ